jgi:pyrroline-5-carboxylate reductase
MPPDVHDLILNQLKGMISGQLVITVAGGISPSHLEAMLPAGTPVVSVLPNTAAKSGQSMMLFHSANLSARSIANGQKHSLVVLANMNK